jgi:streptogramin lyase
VRARPALAIGLAATSLVACVHAGASPSTAARMRVTAKVGVGIRLLRHGLCLRKALDGDERRQPAVRIDLRTRKVLKRVLRRGPCGLAAGAGSIWVDGYGSSVVERVNPRTARVTRRFRTEPAPWDVAFFDGAVWTTHFGLLTRIDPATGRTVRRFELAGDLSNMDVGFDSLWVGANDGTVAYRVRPDGRVDTLQVDAQGPSSFAVGRDAVWVTARPGDVVRRIDPATNELGPPIAVGSNPTMGAEAADGSIVVPNTGDGTLSRIDPSRNAVVETIRVGSRPVKVVRVGGALWVTHLGGNAVWRVNLVS